MTASTMEAERGIFPVEMIRVTPRAPSDRRYLPQRSYRSADRRNRYNAKDIFLYSKQKS